MSLDNAENKEFFTYFLCKVLSIIGERIISRLEALRGFVVSVSVRGRVDS